MINYDWVTFGNDIKELASKIDFQPASIVAITKGGLCVAGALSQYFDTKIIDTIGLSSYKDEERQELVLHKAVIEELPSPVLIIDDIADSGETMEYVLRKFHNAKSATLFYKPHSKVKPDYYLHEVDEWVVFPWEIT